ncbi:MAG TPA: YdeI/OmpD-associated family protein [Caulobacteraceae bacterium]
MAEALHKGLPVASFPDQGAWGAWMTAQGMDCAGVWLKIAKPSAGAASVTKAQAVEEALRCGWIDGQLDKWDADWWLTRFTPRGPKSKWSQINRATAERLIAAGRITDAGLAEVEKAKADGRWAAAYPAQSKAEVPPDLAAALAAEPAAEAFFATLTGANRYAVLYRVHEAKTAKTRAARIDRFVAMLARGEVLHPKP